MTCLHPTNTAPAIYFVDRENRCISLLTPDFDDMVLHITGTGPLPPENPAAVAENALLYDVHPDTAPHFQIYKFRHDPNILVPTWLVGHCIDAAETYLIHTANPRIILTVDHDEESARVEVLACEDLWTRQAIHPEEILDMVHAAKDHLVFHHHP